MRLENKVAVITGAASGFGEGMARRFAAEGAKVVVADLNEEAGQSIAGEIDGLFVKTDVSRNNEMADLVQSAVRKFGDIDIFINNAGYTSRNSPMLDVDEETFDRIYAVNVKAV
ncbi:SDR family NAD(P)-dependent oxidoreductase, partial [bacterium]|nr:SDR family NAD(P)-dependent oxidoreductase [bacterium]